MTLERYQDAAIEARNMMPRVANQETSTSAEARDDLSRSRQGGNVDQRINATPNGVAEILHSNAGNCDECAAVAFANLVTHHAIEPGASVSKMAGRDGLDHVYLKSEHPGREPYVIDTWPVQPFAGPMQHHELHTPNDFEQARLTRSNDGHEYLFEMHTSNGIQRQQGQWADLHMDYTLAIHEGLEARKNNMDYQFSHAQPTPETGIYHQPDAGVHGTLDMTPRGVPMEIESAPSSPSHAQPGHQVVAMEIDSPPPSQGHAHPRR